MDGKPQEVKPFVEEMEQKNRSSIKSRTVDLTNRWMGLAWVMIFLNVALLFITIAIIVVWREDINSRKPSIDTQQFCLPCDDVSLHEDEDKYNLNGYERKKDSDGKLMCCANTAEKLQSIVGYFVERKYREEKARNPVYCSSVGTESKNYSAARVVGVKNYKEDQQYRPAVILWKDESHQSFVNKDVRYTDGSFEILKKGFYYIYSQVTFLEEKVVVQPENARSMYASLCHFVFRQKANMPDRPEKLLESSQSKCELQSQSSNSTSYIGAVFYMEVNDRVMVKVTYPGKITNSSYSNYFGLHMI